MTPFEQFWAVYPRRVAKLSAEKAFNKALKLTSLESLLLGAQAYAEEVLNTESLSRPFQQRFIAHPATWLNAGRWMDEAERTGVDTDKYRQPTPEEARIYRAENAWMDRDPEWIPRSWQSKIRLVK